jgi:hypothetical protein
MDPEKQEQAARTAVAAISPSAGGEPVADQAGAVAAPTHVERQREQVAADGPIASLTGELIPAELGRPGFWAYRLLPSGRLLETELTCEESNQLDKQRTAKRRARIAALNEHPLNQAAKWRLQQEKQRPVGNDMHLFELAWMADPGEGMGDAGLMLGRWSLTPEDQRTALRAFEEGITPHEIMEEPLDRVLEYVLAALQNFES